ncbi:hypothetical protein M413DRAFT_446927 [Hebeloma cylindrosporum]|uniref:Zn(2)-C6 fungal-type domain-containing protein n=1 Tax=Hebeloma cylindrosporum TaxID=76867 RepID=A0A0C3BRT1_HEBCY|nr:hypothetical protein M413DRAFT_446927 [Hebeloma cylindrosporum h7]
MPAELSKSKLKRRTSRKELDEYRFDGTHGRELELKRNRGEVSCAECRRLKIKCDKQIPCQSCQRRGCASLCPNGSLATGQGTRFVLAATEHLHRRIAGLSGRIRQLEDALSILHGKHSSDPHPLLQEDLIHADERDGDTDAGSEEAMDKMLQPGEALDAFGTLSISEHGISRFFGPTGGSESLLLTNLDSNHGSPESISDSLHGPTTPSSLGDLSHFSQSFPFTPMGQAADVQEIIESHLPPYEQGLALCETYFDQVSWMFRGVTREQLVDDMLPVIYKMQVAPPGEDYSGPHDLALLFIVLAIGAVVGKDAAQVLGGHFYQISRAAIALQPVLEKPSIVTIQTLYLMSIYNGMSGDDMKSDTNMEMTWSLVTLASNLSQTIGLHRDSAHWGLSPKMTQRRRILFWDLFVSDVWQSLNTGRPPSFSMAYSDCGYPQAATDGCGRESDFGTAYGVWQARFAAECVADVTTRTLTTEAPSYTTIMELDRKVREFPLPEGTLTASEDQATSFQSFVLEHLRETLLMYIHRGFFAQAIIEHPVNPLKSVYAPSFLATYRASSTILKSVREQFNLWPNSCSRFWQMWTFAFSAAVVFGTVVTRGPRSPLAQSAMTELEQACILFSKASVHSIRAAKALPVLTKLNEKARHALAMGQSETSPMSFDKGGLWNIKQEDDDELSILAGRTRFVSTRRGTGSTSTSPPRSLRFEPSPPHYSSPQPNDLSSQQQRQPQHQQQVPRPPPGLPSSTYPHHSVTLPETSSSSSGGSERWSPSTGSSASCDSYMAPPMDSLHFPYSAAERTHKHSPPAIPSSTSPYGWPTDDLQDQPPPVSNPNSMYHLQPPTSSFTSSPSSFSSSPQPDSLFPPQNHQSRRQSPQHQSANQHERYHMLNLQPSHPHAHFPSQYPPQELNPSTHIPHQHSQQQYSIYNNNNAPTTGGYTLPPGGSPNMDLGDLGLASRDSRLDDRWGSFMADPGLLEDFRQGLNASV